MFCVDLSEVSIADKRDGVPSEGRTFGFATRLLPNEEREEIMFLVFLLFLGEDAL